MAAADPHVLSPAVARAGAPDDGATSLRRSELLHALLTPRAARETADSPAANALITVVASLASGLLVLEAGSTWAVVHRNWLSFGIFVVVTFGLQLVSVQVYDRGAFSFAGSGMLALGFLFGVGVAMTISAAMGIINLVRRRGRFNRGIYDAAQWALAAGAGAACYRAFGAGGSAAARLVPALLAAGAFFVVNIGLLTAAMSVSEVRDPREVFRERFRWMIPYHLVSGALALALVFAYQRMGTIGLVAFAAPPAFMMFGVREYLAKTREAVAEVRRANEELEAAVDALKERNADLQDVLAFAGGLAARVHDQATLVGYAEDALTRILGVGVTVSRDESGAIPLEAGGEPVGSLVLGAGRPGPRWGRLRAALLPQLATALESTTLVDEVRRRHLATIAALSRSMEAKDYYTGGHTERVGEIAVAIGRKLALEGAELDAIEVGALLHDIGKIGIPEAVLHKPGPLDDEEWELMRRHPVISDYILSEIDLHPFVRQIARSSHERMDGNGYPDGLAADEIPLAARIVSVADALDALTSDRPYRKARPLAAALVELREHTGAQFCPIVMSALEAVVVEEPEVLGFASSRLQPVAVAAG